MAIGFHTQKIMIVIELKNKPCLLAAGVSNSFTWKLFSKYQIALKGNWYKKIKQRWRILLITVNTTKTEFNYLASALVLLKTCCCNTQWNIFSVNVFCFTKLSVFRNQRYNSLKSDIAYPLCFEGEHVHLLSDLLEALLCLSWYFIFCGKEFSLSLILLYGKVIEVLKSIFP